MTGLVGTSAVGSATSQVNISTTLTGVAGTGGVGDSSLIGDGVVNVTGLSSSTSVGNVLLWGLIIPAPGTTWSEIAA